MASSANKKPTVIVTTSQGKIRGNQFHRHQSFLGIPYAAPPVGPLRFRGPQPVSPWTGVRDALSFGCSEFQESSTWPGMEVGNQSEDCLYLNVYTPQTDSLKRPVMFWIHGGGFTYGSGSQQMFNGEKLVTRGDVVLVTFNYRLGIFGFLNLPGTSPNAGLQDQIAALIWVQDNIAFFGGDPDNVTLFGESAGGISAALHLAIPDSRDLFHRVITQSGSVSIYGNRLIPVDNSHILADEMGVEKLDLEKLRDLPAARLLKAQTHLIEKLQSQFIFLPFRPVIDGKILPKSPLQAIKDGEARDKQLMAGSNKDELKAFNFDSPFSNSLDQKMFLFSVRSMLRDIGHNEGYAETLIEIYRREKDLTDGTPFDILMAINNDCFFRLPAIISAEAQQRYQPDTYVYLFTWPSPAFEGMLGACHALEIPFVFGTYEARGMSDLTGTGIDVGKLSLQMMDAWIAFARNGNPNHTGIPCWERYDSHNRATMVFDKLTSLAHKPFDATRAAWEKIIENSTHTE
jgi:para-nitrobenzyl esterase